MFKFLKDRFERRLFFWATVALVCLCVVKIKFMASDYMLINWPNVVMLFQSVVV